MENKTKKKEDNGGLLLLGGGILAAIALSGKKETPPSDSGGAVTVTFKPVAPAGTIGAFDQNSPVLEGQQTVMTVSVKNTSTLNGVAAPANLSTKIKVDLFTALPNGVKNVLPEFTQTYSFQANETKTYTNTITAPLGSGGNFLQGYATVYDPNGAVLASGFGSQPITSLVLAAEIYASYLAWWDGVAEHSYSNWIQILSGAPLAVTLNSVIALFYSWRNSSNVPISGAGYVQITKPDGTVYTVIGKFGQNVTLQPTGTSPIEFFTRVGNGIDIPTFNANQVGTYHILEHLTGSNGISVTTNYDIVVQASIVYSATIQIT